GSRQAGMDRPDRTTGLAADRPYADGGSHHFGCRGGVRPRSRHRRKVLVRLDQPRRQECHQQLDGQQRPDRQGTSLHLTPTKPTAARLGGRSQARLRLRDEISASTDATGTALSPPPLAGEGQGGGLLHGTDSRQEPPPNPPQQAGGEERVVVIYRRLLAGVTP